MYIKKSKIDVTKRNLIRQQDKLKKIFKKQQPKNNNMLSNLLAHIIKLIMKYTVQNIITCSMYMYTTHFI